MTPRTLALLALLGACKGGEPDDSAHRDSEAPPESESPDDSPADSPDDSPVDSPPVALEILGQTTATLAEEEAATLSFTLSRPARLFALDLPPGARWDEQLGALSFTPDFIQGGRDYLVTLLATDGASEARLSLTLTVADTIAPPAPTLTATETGEGWVRYRLSQTTDATLDSPGNAGRSLGAIVCVPTAATAEDPAPVQVVLHGLGATPNPVCSTTTVLINPADPDISYWFGYASSLPEADPAGEVLPYTQRRVLALLEWTLANVPAADPERVSIQGVSMGGAGAVTLGLMRARHFSWVQSFASQTVPLLHRPTRQAQLATLWGSVAEALPGESGQSVWEEQDLTRVLLESPEAREQFLYTKHGKDDANVLFGTMVFPSPLTGLAFASTLQAEHIGHFLVWDESSHYASDPVMGPGWWQNSRDLSEEGGSGLALHRSFPAFSAYGLDGAIGGGGNGLRAYDEESGYAGDEAIAGDTGWDGDIAGTFNRGLRWDASLLVDEIDRWSVPIRALDGEGGAAPQAGYPSTGDRPNGALPALVSVTPRRVQRFQLLPGETVDWTYGDLSGAATANERGELTVEGLPLSSEWETLTLSRRW